jgi:hypothetical protein
MGLPELDGVAIPPGRIRATIEEVAATWVDAPAFAQSTHRRAIWGEWLQAAAALRDAVPVCVAWLGGSFLSSKPEPGDLDCVWIIDDVMLATAKMDPQRARLIALFANNQLGDVGMRVDSYVLAWRRRPGIAPRDQRDHEYVAARGYWDDFWQRTRNGAKGSQPHRDEALPRRGYLEVVLDGFPQ